MTARKAKPIATLTPEQAEFIKREQARAKMADAYAAYCEAMGTTGVQAGSFKNMIVGFVGSIVTMVLGYTAGMCFANMLASAFFMLTGWAYMSAAIYLIAFFISAVASIYAAGRVAGYLAKGEYAADMASVANWVTGKFSRASTYVKEQMARDSVTVH